MTFIEVQNKMERQTLLLHGLSRMPASLCSMLHWMIFFSCRAVILIPKSTHLSLMSRIKLQRWQPTLPRANKLIMTLHLFTWEPKVFVDAINHETARNKDGHLIGPCGAASQITANSYFTYITNFVPQEHSNVTMGRKFLEPSSFWMRK
jgi:hypothetical protein